MWRDESVSGKKDQWRDTVKRKRAAAEVTAAAALVAGFTGTPNSSK
jgi:hypothetical protein